MPSLELNLAILGRIFEKKLLGLVEVLGLLAVRIETEEVECRRNTLVGGVQHVDAAVLELADHRGIEQHSPRVDRRVRHALLDLVDIEGEARGAPHVDEGMLVARIGLRDPLHQLRVEVLPVRDLRLVELLEDAGLDLARQEVGGGHDEVVARVAGEQLGLQDVVAVVDIVDDLDAGLLGEALQDRRVDIVRPVVDLDHLLLGLGQGGGGKQQKSGQGMAKEQAHRALRRRGRASGKGRLGWPSR